VQFFTCARPGRSKGARRTVEDELVHKWVQGLPFENKISIVSLLGKKPNGKSEWSFYSFYLKGETFQDWLDYNYAEREFRIIERPTIDSERVSVLTLDVVRSDILTAHSKGRACDIMDSGGEQRSGQVCASMHAKEIASFGSN
jgi:hypothetical protein